MGQQKSYILFSRYLGSTTSNLSILVPTLHNTIVFLGSKDKIWKVLRKSSRDILKTRFHLVRFVLPHPLWTPCCHILSTTKIITFYKEPISVHLKKKQLWNTKKGPWLKIVCNKTYQVCTKSITILYQVFRFTNKYINNKSIKCLYQVTKNN